MTSTKDDASKIIGFWDEIASDYSSNYTECVDLSRWVSLIVDTSFPNSKVLKIADIGAGSAMLAKAFSRLGYDVTVTELSEEMLNSAIYSAEMEDLHITFIKDDITRTKLPKESFDIVLLRDLLFNIESSEKALQNAVGLLRPGGLLVIADGNFIQHNHIEEFRLRRNYNLLKDGTDESAKLLRLSEDRYQKLESMVRDYPINECRRPHWDVTHLLDLGMGKIRLICDANNAFSHLTENGNTTVPMKFVLMAEKPSTVPNDSDANFTKMGDTYVTEISTAPVSDIFSAIGNTYRVKIIRTLLRKSKNVKELAEIIELNENKTCYHLGILKDAGLITGSKVGREMYYKVNDGTDVRHLMELAMRIHKNSENDQ
jgi:2-polyprenyl-3-methyl-5-hydroxy-6-metoxy-1,4-benzoquinol methylase/DNA-binding transcriptional ArsR family regulator